MRNSPFVLTISSRRPQRRANVLSLLSLAVCFALLLGPVGWGTVGWSSSNPTHAADTPYVDTPYVDAELYYRLRSSATIASIPVANIEVIESANVTGPILTNSTSMGPTSMDLVFEGRVFEAPVWQWLPDSLIYHSYMAGAHEPRLSGTTYWDQDGTLLLASVLGGRVGLIRYGTTDNLWPEGWQLDIEGAAFPRLNLDEDWDMETADFRVGLPLTFGHGNWQAKFAYYHLSSHLGDEFALRNPGSLASRINYSRDALVLGVSYYATPAMRFYAESGWAFYMDGGSEPWEFQMGVDWSAPGPTGSCGTPFMAINGHLREELNYGGNLVVQTGWLWRGPSGHTFRTGLHYYNGKSSQYQFFNQFEQQLGLGVWYDY